MAYGKNKAREDWMMRAVPLTVGTLSTAKKGRLFALRERVLVLMREMASAGFSPEPLSEQLTGTALDDRLLRIQKNTEGLNSVWREQARMRVRPALEASCKRYFSRLSGSLRFIDQRIPEADKHPDSTRVYFNIPESVQDVISENEIAALKAIADKGGAIKAFRQWLSGEHDFSENQVAVLAAIHERTQAKHTAPDFGASDDFTLQLHLDARMLPKSERPEALMLRDGVAVLLCDDSNVLYHRFLDLSGVAARESRIRLPLALSKKVAKRIEETNSEWASLVLELSKDNIGVRLVAGKPEIEPPASVKAFVGRDFGYTNTVTLSVAVSEALVDIDEFSNTCDGLTTKDSVQKFLTSHQQSSSLRVVKRVRYSGRKFLAKINILCEKIDGYKSRIDRCYNHLNDLKQIIVADLGLQPEDWITPEMKPLHPSVGLFFAQMGQINDLKQARRDVYARIKAIKKSWFGMLSNIELTLAKEYNAAIVREDLTVEAVEKTDPGYKGRVFNKMINNGSKGQYQRRAAQKMLWNGVPEIVVPSWYTSRTCTQHGVILEAKHRKGESIFLPCCNRHDHADEHAADTIACIPTLQPRLTEAAKLWTFVTPASPLVGSPVL